jgi:hypothetical protein
MKNWVNEGLLLKLNKTKNHDNQSIDVIAPDRAKQLGNFFS